MIYVSRGQVIDLVASRVAGSILVFARSELTGNGDLDEKTVVRMLWEFRSLTEGVARLPGFSVPQPRLGIPDEVRERIFNRDGRRCLKCGIEESLAIDHVVSLDAGGLHDESNFQTLCGPCNRQKGTDSVDYRVFAPEPAGDVLQVGV